MLVITRRENEAIKVGSDVELIVTSIRGNKVRIGIVAPSATRVVRSETDAEGRTVTAKTKPSA